MFHGFGMGGTAATTRRPEPLEANDLFPVTFAAATIALLAVGVSVAGGSTLVPIGVGITAYGAAYLLVHDVVIHRRLPWPRIPDGWGTVGGRTTSTTSTAGPPFGFLAPIVPPGSPPRRRRRRPDTSPAARPA